MDILLYIVQLEPCLLCTQRELYVIFCTAGEYQCQYASHRPSSLIHHIMRTPTPLQYVPNERNKIGFSYTLSSRANVPEALAQIDYLPYLHNILGYRNLHGASRSLQRSIRSSRTTLNDLTRFSLFGEQRFVYWRASERSYLRYYCRIWSYIFCR